MRKELGITWTKREALMDFVMTRPKMKKLLPHFEPVFAQLSRIPKKIRDASREYVRSLGLAKQQAEFEVTGSKVMIRGDVVGKELTKQEKVVLKLLVGRLGDLVTYDELADTIWGEGEFKSFWALNKVVERLRHKLVGMGIEGSKLESVRGQGYILTG
jgi:DNA-binding response OmpR family regulator